MKVSYTQCDICEQKIEGELYKFRYLERYPDAMSFHHDIIEEARMDVCKDCMDRFAKWVKQELEKKRKEKPDGTNTRCTVD